MVENYEHRSAGQRICIALLQGYRIAISPYLGDCCRFYPSCSQYAMAAIKKQGVFRGLLRTAKRLACCHPLHPGGVDFP